MSDCHNRMVDTYQGRKRRNEESKTWARRDGQPWTKHDEDVLIAQWIDMPPEKRDERAVSRVLERTIEACRVRCEHIRARLGTNVVMERHRTTTTYIGAYDDPSECWWAPNQEG